MSGFDYIRQESLLLLITGVILFVITSILYVLNYNSPRQKRDRMLRKQVKAHINSKYREFDEKVLRLEAELHQNLATALQSQLKESGIDEDKESLNEFVQIVVGLTNDINSSNQIATRLSERDDLRRIFQGLEGKEVTTNTTAVKFGEGSQFGDITIRDIANGSIFNFSLQVREVVVSHIHQQIEELYAPLLRLILDSKRAHDAVSLMLPSKDGVIDRDKFQEKDHLIWEHYVENYFLPINRKIKELIEVKSHLIEEYQFSGNFEQFLQHQHYFESFYMLWKEKSIDTRNLPTVTYPSAFSEEIEDMMKKLRSKLQSYY